LSPQEAQMAELAAQGLSYRVHVAGSPPTA
jgi:hypothetical protein